MRCPLPVQRQPLHRRTNLLRRPRLTTPPLRNRKRPAPDALPPPTKIGRGKRSPWSLPSRADPFCGSRETLPHPLALNRSPFRLIAQIQTIIIRITF